MPTASTKSVSLFTEVEALRMEKVGLEVALRTRDEKIALVEEENERLREMLIKMRKQA